MVEEFASVVDRYGQELVRSGAPEEAAEGAENLASGDAAELFEEVVAGFAFNEGEQAALAVDARDDGVHFPVSEFFALTEVRTLCDGEVSGIEETAAERGVFLGVLGGLVGQLGGENAQISVVDVVVDGSRAGEVGNALLAQAGQGVVGRTVVIDDFDAQELGDGGRHLHGTSFVEVAGVDGGLGDFSRVVPDFLVVEEVGGADEAAVDFIVESAVGEADLAGESPAGETFPLGQAEIAVVLDFDGLAHGVGNMLAFHVVDVAFSGHGGFLSGLVFA